MLPLVSYVAHASVTDDDDRRQRPLLVCPPTLCAGRPVISAHKEKKKQPTQLQCITTRLNMHDASIPHLKKIFIGCPLPGSEQYG